MIETLPSSGVGAQGPRQGYNRDRFNRTPEIIVRGQLTTANNTTVWTATTNAASGSNLGAELCLIALSNSDSVARTVAAHLVESGGSVAANRLVLPTISIPANSAAWITFDEREGYCEAGEFLNLIAGTANTISYRIVAWRLQS